MSDIKTWSEQLEALTSDQTIVTNAKIRHSMQVEISDLRARVAELEAEQVELERKPVAPERYAPYGIIDPDYARVYTQARIIAWQYGYACLLHGSFTRDLDLLMAPWTEQARGNGEQILKLIAQACNLRFKDGEKDILKSKADWSEKPHARKSCSLYFPRFGDHRWIDISFVPVHLAAGVRKAQPERQPMTVEHVRAAGGIVHKDGNIFFTNIEKLNTAITGEPK